MSFAHLHLHTEYSLLDGAARITDVVEAAAADDQPAIAITDHGNLYGVVDFVKAANNVGIKPIIGIEAYYTEGSRWDRPVGAENRRYHMNLLAENEVGYRNLLQLSSKAFLDGYYYKPRMDIELLAEHSEGIIATSGCLGGLVPQLLAPDAVSEEGNKRSSRDIDAAVAAAVRFQDVFGKDNFFIEVQDHGIEAQRRIMPDLLEIASRIDAPLLATNDAHYTRRDEHDAHDVLLCIQTGSLRNEPGRLRFEGSEHYLKSSDEMRRLFPGDEFPKACDNTLWIAERANVEIEFGKILLPHFSVPEGETELTYLRRLVEQGTRERYGAEPGAEVWERVEHELKIIEEMGFPAYFLIVWDIIRHARENRIRVGPGRGSAAGSIVSYCLRITDIDPLAYGLIFERFLNPGRQSMPDIDMDFDERYRGEMIRYAAEKYGSDRVAQIITFATIKGKQAIRDAARVLGHPYSMGDRLAKAMPPSILGKDPTLDQVLSPPSSGAASEVKDWYANAHGLREMYEADPSAKEVIDAARGLEGLRRQDSIHAAAVVIAPEPLIGIVPVQRKGEDAEMVTQFEMHGIEALGLLKMDFLGLRNLSIIERCLELVEETTGERVDIDNVPTDDPTTFELLQSGNTIGVFQMEGTAMRALIRSLKPDIFDDVIALVALYRPGPMGANMHNLYADRKNGRAEIEELHPVLTEKLADTYQIMVYQEQVMMVAQEIAGYSMADADELRRAMGKKIKSVMVAEEEKFVTGTIDQGFPEETGREIFKLIEHFAGYGFNRSHSAGYGLLAYQTAYLKAHHPAEYLAALLTATKTNKDRTAVYLNECRRMGIEVLVPDINESESDFTVHDGRIRFGLSAVRNVGEGAVEKIIEARQDQPLKSFMDFVNRVDTAVLNKRSIESLIKAGAFDGSGDTRKGLTLVHEQILDATLERRRNEEMGQYSLFAGDDDSVEETNIEVPDLAWPQKTRLAFEKEMLGLYVSDHPLLSLGAALAAATSTSIAELGDLSDRSSLSVGGIVGSITRRWTKKGDPMLFFQLEDLEGSVECIAFPKTVHDYGPLIVEDAVLVISGHLDHRGDDVKVVARELKELEIRDDSTIRLTIPAGRLTPETVNSLKTILKNHPGSASVYLHMTDDGDTKVLKLSDAHKVEPRSALFAELKELLGPKAIL
ncbi:MAG: DNA polymerase III subunit alpha [Acidobacteria bacterium]|nr:DNA polymerase III subunit alpha [Acidobacteriota bacterium]TDI55463.1 MAG: DNA polymerase III subunit alpha [Acidobacteriota bacterium]